MDYRRAPESPFPLPVVDRLEAYRWLLKAVHPSRILLAGDSAGGALVVSTLLAATECALPRPAGAILLSPWVDLQDVTRDSW